MIPAAFDYLAPTSLDDAVRALAQHGDDAKILAGGHSLLPLMKLRLAAPKLLVDLKKIPGLAGIKLEGNKLVVGARATHYQIESSALAQTKCPLLCETARAIGDVQVRNFGTIGGSLIHADPAADWPAAMLALAAELSLAGPKGERYIPAENFFLGPMTTAAEATEILTAIRIPGLSARSGSAYLKMAQPASGFAIIGVAVSLRVDRNGGCEDIGIGVTGLGEKPFRATSVEARLRGKPLTSKSIAEASALVTEGREPLEDLHASADYRAHLARIYAERAIQEAAKRAAKKRQ